MTTVSHYRVDEISKMLRITYNAIYHKRFFLFQHIKLTLKFWFNHFERSCVILFLNFPTTH